MKTEIVNTTGYRTLQKQLNRYSCGYFLASDSLSRGAVAEAHREELQATAVVPCEQRWAHITVCSRCHSPASETHSLFILSYSPGSFAPVSGKEHPGSIHHVF